MLWPAVVTAVRVPNKVQGVKLMAQDQYRKDGPDKHPPQERSEHHDKQNPDPARGGERQNDRPDNGNRDRDDFENASANE